MFSVMDQIVIGAPKGAESAAFIRVHFTSMVTF
jgi:hypothetical protein